MVFGDRFNCTEIWDLLPGKKWSFKTGGLSQQGSFKTGFMSEHALIGIVYNEFYSFLVCKKKSQNLRFIVQNKESGKGNECIMASNI